MKTGLDGALSVRSRAQNVRAVDEWHGLMRALDSVGPVWFDEKGVPIEQVSRLLAAERKQCFEILKRVYQDSSLWLVRGVVPPTLVVDVIKASAYFIEFHFGVDMPWVSVDAFDKMKDVYDYSPSNIKHVVDGLASRVIHQVGLENAAEGDEGMRVHVGENIAISVGVAHLMLGTSDDRETDSLGVMVTGGLRRQAIDFGRSVLRDKVQREIDARHKSATVPEERVDLEEGQHE